MRKVYAFRFTRGAMVFELGRNAFEAELHERDIAFDVLAPEEASEAFVEAFDKGLLSLEGVLYHLCDAGARCPCGSPG